MRLIIIFMLLAINASGFYWVSSCDKKISIIECPNSPDTTFFAYSSFNGTGAAKEPRIDSALEATYPNCNHKCKYLEATGQYILGQYDIR